MSKEHVLRREQWLPGTLESCFPFFSRAQNLQAITPPWMGFRFRGAPPETIETGTRIAYTIRLGGIPMGWRTRIEDWNPPVSFIDIQEAGPYKQWIHLHHLAPAGDGVLMTDVVRYRLPFGPLGRLVNLVMVRNTLDRVFDHRYSVVREMIGGIPIAESHLP